MQNKLTKESKACINCVHVYIKPDSLIMGGPETYCNLKKNKPLSGDVLTEPFDYYEPDDYTLQCKVWEEWAAQNRVAPDHSCEELKMYDYEGNK